MEMQKYLLIAEKPSLMKEIQNCYNRHKQEVVAHLGAEIDFLALSGHVCTNFEPTDYPEWENKKWREVEYPMIPKPWRIKPINDKNKKKTIEKIEKLLPNYSGIICATDSDTEGYGIYFLLERYLKISKPTLRFMEHSLTEKEILKSLMTMTDFHKDPQHVNTTASFLLRSHADWLFGMNASRVMSNKQGRLFKIGRVKSPTIKLVYDNSMAIDNFQAKAYYAVVAEYEGFKAVLQKGKEDAKFDRIEDIPAFSLDGEVAKLKSNKALKSPPKLFDLAAVQAEAGRKFKLKPDKTLEIIQALYQNHKVISYPRTQCRYISSEKAKELGALLESTKAFADLEPFVNSITAEDIARVAKDKNVVNDTEVSKESHDALLPTTNKPNLAKMSEDEKNVCQLIYARLIMQFLGKEEGEKTVLTIKHDKGLFKAEGKTITKKGWTVLHKEEKDVILPKLSVGDKITAKSISPDERKTKAPARLTQATLINAMRNIATQIEDPVLKKSLAESQGIGTPATRAAIIKDIIDTGYVRDQKDGLYITEEGKSYIESMRDIDIVSPIFAAEMDTSIKRIQRGEEGYKDAERKVITKLYEMVRQIEKIRVNYYNEDIDISEGIEEKELRCPKCSQPLVLLKNRYVCKQKCGFVLGKTILGYSLSDSELKEIMMGSKIGPCEFTSKTGKKFDASISLDDEKNLRFEFR